MEDKLNFIKASFNEKFPFPDNTFDGLYNIQALSYSIDYNHVFGEIFRVMKPGAKLSFLEWFIYDNYDANNATHVELMRRNKAIIGAVYNPTTKDMTDALKKVGFDIVVDENASIDGH